jgi:hypothetical protein
VTSRRLARAQSRLDVVPGETPAEFRLGRCIEVWGTSNGEGDGQAWMRYLQGLRAYAATIGKDKIARPPCHFGSVPWSDRLLTTGSAWTLTVGCCREEGRVCSPKPKGSLFFQAGEFAVGFLVHMRFVRLLALALTVATMLMLVAPAQARVVTRTVNTIDDWDGSTIVAEFGVPNTATYGQTMRVPVTRTTRLQKFSFVVKLPTTLQFTGYVYRWNGHHAVGARKWSSQARTTASAGAFQVITFRPNGLRLRAGARYVLFVSVSQNYVASSGVGVFAQPQNQDLYSGGQFVYINNGTDESQWLTTDWDPGFGGGEDLAFRMELTRS